MSGKDLLKEVKPMDWLIIALAGYLLFFRIDYQNLETIDTVYLISFSLWLAMFVVRLYLLSKGRRL